ncbi:Coenzyme F420 hydrogenase/dehydrogenase, beta subunit C-terminal domain [Tsuneonella sp. SYSU-LHT278]|uniref:Coenzyme F420 hydrogenase/dehydrogenase, beta subunit C-terminal domain n=1 Tax=Tsuneonella sediminis TaxID=3416089 RepID=UPI003F7AA348
MSIDLATIVDNGMCLGCGGCVAAIGRPDFAMEMSAEGYLRPIAATPLSASERETLAEVCSGRTMAHDGEAGLDYHPLWGPLRRVATGHATDPEVRYRGSSGGVLTAIAIALVECGAVEFVLSTAAGADDPIGNETAPRGDRNALMAAAGSRYAPSAPLAGLERHLAADSRFAFIGKPCDVATLRRMAKRDPRIDRCIPYMFAFFCAGVPSRKGTLDLLDAMGLAPADVGNFRFRGDGWPGLARAISHDGSEATMDYNSSWGTILNRHLQFRCKICPDGTGEFADIVCADAWYGKDGYPEFAEQDGRSLIIARTPAGEQLLREIESAGRITTMPLDVREIARMQPYQAHRKCNVIARLAGLKAKRRPTPRYRRLGLLRLALRSQPLEQIRNLIGTYRRAIGRLA